MNYLNFTKEYSEKFLEKYAHSAYIPSLSFFYEKDNKVIGVSIKNNTISRKIFKEQEECSNWLESKYTSKLNENISNIPKLREWMTIQNLMDADIVADETKKFAQQRYGFYKGENINAKLKSAIYDSANDTMTFIFATPATMKAHDPGYTADIVDPLNNFQNVANPTHTYQMMIRVIDFMKWLKDTRPDNAGPISWKEIKAIFDVAYIQVWCNCQSFHWFGKNYRATQFDASIYPTNIPDTVMKKRFGEYDLLCKHLSNLMKPQAIQFFLPQMASATQKELRTKGLI